MIPTIQTDRLVLRVPTKDDLEAYARIFADPEGMRFYPKTYDLEEVAEWVEAWPRRWDERGYGFFSAVEKRTREMIGRIGFNLLDGGPEVEVGWNLARAVWGRGLATEGARACLTWWFVDRANEEIVAVLKGENVRSVRVAEKLGMRYDRDGVFYGELQRHYVLTRSEWER